MPDRHAVAIFFAFPIALVVSALIVAGCGQTEAAPVCLRIQAADLTDGDSARVSGTSYRLTGRDAPLNAPETRAGSQGRAGAVVTEREAEWGVKATAYGRRLLSGGGAALCPTGRHAGFGRPEAIIVLKDGRDYGAALVGAGLATATARREHEHWNAKKP